MKVFIVSCFLFIFLLGCSSSDSEVESEDSGEDSKIVKLIQPIAELGDARVKKELPLQLWQWTGETKRLTVHMPSESGGGTTKKVFCVIEGDGEPLSLDTEVEDLEEAVCTHVLHQKDGFKRYPVGLKRIKVLSNGKEGWTWSSAIQKQTSWRAKAVNY